ncbi:MAG TPA: hypothetical protein VHE30_07870 [Polyangiaceae bacterium]|nr:hypothetical protein [Polyangiaceae bacterium]
MSSFGRVGRVTRALRALLFALPLLFLVSWSGDSHAYPWMIKHGFAKCASCHTDPMGGETLTGFGRVISDTTLSSRYDGGKDPRPLAELFFGVEEPRALSLGGSVRYMDALYTLPEGNQKGKLRQFPMQADVYGELRPLDRLRISGSIGASRVPLNSPYATAAQITKNNDGDQFNAISRTHWIGYDISDEFLVRAGRMNLPFGVRIPEHVMYVRKATRTDRESAQQHGIALSYSSGRIRGEVMGILGNYQISPDKFRERGYSLYGEYLLGLRTAIGVSSLVTTAEDDRFLQTGNPYLRQAHGLTARVAPLPELAVLAEADLLLGTETPKTGASISTTGYVGMVQADYEFIQGFHGLVTGEVVDTGKPNSKGAVAIAGAGKPQFGAWFSVGWFFFTHFDARVDFVVRDEKSIQSQIHYYF